MEEAEKCLLILVFIYCNEYTVHCTDTTLAYSQHSLSQSYRQQSSVLNRPSRITGKSEVVLKIYFY
jgi:hypothetical protein